MKRPEYVRLVNTIRAAWYARIAKELAAGGKEVLALSTAYSSLFEAAVTDAIIAFLEEPASGRAEFPPILSPLGDKPNG